MLLCVWLRAIVEADGRGMAERARLAGSRLEIDSEPGRGTTVFLSIRLQPGQ